jgi:hypothetical protein
MDTIDIEIDASHNNFTYYSGVLPTNWIMQIKVYSDNNLTIEYFQYNKLSKNTYYIGNITITLTGIYEDYGIIVKTEQLVSMLFWVGMVFVGLIITFYLHDLIDAKWYYWQYIKKQKKKNELKKKKKEQNLKE